MKKVNREKLTDALFNWGGPNFGMDDTVVASINPDDSTLIWVVKYGGELTNNMAEYSILRAFMINGKPVVSADLQNASADEAFAKLGEVMFL